jgi:putative component of membrane protein insertase Oxa1/YidC/SpoIIIJ protein YidD
MMMIKLMVLFHHSMFSPLLDESCLFFHTSSVYVDMFWFVSFGFTSFKLSMVLSLKFECNDHTSIGFFM